MNAKGYNRTIRSRDPAEQIRGVGAFILHVDVSPLNRRTVRGLLRGNEEVQSVDD